MLPFFTEKFGNASSKNHPFGWEAEAAVDSAREQVARLIGASSPREIVFTSGATESDNLAIKGVAQAYRERGNHIVTCATEHKAVLDACKALEKQGFKVTYLRVQTNGLVDLQRLEDSLTDKTILVSIMAANNEIGTIQPVEEIGRLTKKKGIFFHTDATQAVGKIPVDVDKMAIDLLSLTAHKFYGPKGVGALYVRSGIEVEAQIRGGGQEFGRRAGTENVAGIVGFARALELVLDGAEARAERIAALRDGLEATLVARVPGLLVNGAGAPRLANTLSVAVPGVDAEQLLIGLDLAGVAVSAGSACTSGALDVSHVVRAIGVPEPLAGHVLRLTLGIGTTREEIDRVGDLLSRLAVPA